MRALLYYDLATKELTTGSSAWTPGTQVFGETMVLSFRFNRTLGGNQSEIFPEINYAKAAIGNLDARPGSGRWKLKVGNAAKSAANTTAWLDFNIGAQGLQEAINALAVIGTEFGVATVRTAGGSYLVTFAGEVLPKLELVESELEPPCFADVTSWQTNGTWVSEMRLIQAPAAFTDTYDRILPPEPTVEKIQEGWTDGDFYGNDIQELTWPSEFRGAFQFVRDNIRTPLISDEDGADELAEALSIYGSGIKVTNDESFKMLIEFDGEFRGEAQPLLGIVVGSAPVGDATLTLPLDLPPLYAMLRAKESVTLPFYIEFGITEDAIVERAFIQLEITIRRTLLYKMLVAAAGVDWLRPVAQDYVPFKIDQVIVGQLFWSGPVGDGESTEITIDHMLATDEIAGVLVCENTGSGRVLVQGTDYTVARAGQNSLVLTILGDPPAQDGLGVVITAAGMRAAFQAHTHTMAQIDGLADVFEQISTRLQTLEDYLPGTSPSVADATSKALTITIPSVQEVLFYKGAEIPEDLSTLPATAPMLLPAVHTEDVLALPTPLPTASNGGGVWIAANRTNIPGGGMIRSSYVPAGGFVASDGRILYPATQAPGTISYYPTPFERTLFEFALADKMLRVNRTLEVKFSLAAQLIRATTEAQWVLVIEHGIPADQADPENTGQDLEDVVWSATPILSQRLIVTPLAVTHGFGCRIKRTSTGLVADKLIYGEWESAAGAAPAQPVFVLRARLIEFDTKNNVAGRGWLTYAIGGADDIKSEATATIS